MNSRMTIGQRFTLTAGMILILSLILTAVGIVSLNGVKTNVYSLTTDSVPGLFDSGAMRSAFLRLQIGYLRHIGESDPSAIDVVEQDITKNSQALAKAMTEYDGTINHEDDRRNFQLLTAQLAAMQAAWQKVQLFSRAAKNVEAMKLYDAELLPQATLASGTVDMVVKWNKDAADVIMAATTKSAETTWWMLLFLGLATLVIGSGVSWYMIRTLNGQMFNAITELSDGAEQIASAASQVSSSSQSLAQGSSEQAASLEETLAGWGSRGQGNTVMPGRGTATVRPWSEGELLKLETLAEQKSLTTEQVLQLLGNTCVDVNLNQEVFWSAVPSGAWEYTLGGYQVLKKWLSYREFALLQRALHIEEVKYFAEAVRRIVSVLLLGPALDHSYQMMLTPVTAEALAE